MTRIKFCGLTRLEDIAAANRAMPSYVGFVFAPSRRQVSPEQAAVLAQALDSRICTVGVFVNEAAEHIAQLYEYGIIQMAQLHGNEDAQSIARLKTLCPRIKVIKAYEYIHGADYLLLDNAQPGSGKPLVTGERAFMALRHTVESSPLPVFLAGGINEDNIARALALRPLCIDISSGIERDGCKDAALMHRLAQLVRQADSKSTGQQERDETP